MSTKRIPYLPSDIIHAIADIIALEFDIENLDPCKRHDRRLAREYYPKDLLSLRASCREFCWIVSSRVFRTLRLTHTLKSIAGFVQIMQSPWVNHCVQSVKYQYWNPGKTINRFAPPPFSFSFLISDYVAAAEPHRYDSDVLLADLISEREAAAEIRQQLSQVLFRLHEFPALRSLSIRFGDIAPVDTELDRIRDDLSSILDALVSLGASLPRPLQSLSLTRLPPIHLEQYNSPAFLALRADLSFFELHLACTDSWSKLVVPPLPPGLISPCEPFIYDTMPGRLLPPPSATTGLANLEALALCFSDPIGIFYLTYSFSELHFPRLRALRLQHVQFSIACDAERFVSQHAETLLELHLLHCQIAVANNEEDQDNDGFDGFPAVPRPWSDIYYAFNDKLARLVFLDVQEPWWISFPDRYITYSPGEMIQFLEEGRDEDKLAIEMFRTTVKKRADKLTVEYERELFSSSAALLPILINKFV